MSKYYCEEVQAAFSSFILYPKYIQTVLKKIILGYTSCEKQTNKDA